jgi:hypothetical protein
VWRPARMEIHWNSIWLRTRSHMTSHYTWRSVTTLHDVGGVLGRPLHAFFWALTISWPRLLAHVWSGPLVPKKGPGRAGPLPRQLPNALWTLGIGNYDLEPSRCFLGTSNILSPSFPKLYFTFFLLSYKGPRGLGPQAMARGAISLSNGFKRGLNWSRVLIPCAYLCVQNTLPLRGSSLLV